MLRRTSALAIAILFLVTSLAAAGEVPVEETSLAQGIMYEIHDDVTGNLYITDWGAGQIWRVDPTTGAYTRFGGLGAPNDGQADGAGNIWYTDYNSPVLGRISPGANPTLTTWNLSPWDPGRTYSLGGLALDENDWVWFSEWDEATGQLLYRFRPDSGELCGYLLPGSGNHSHYVLYAAGFIWLGDSTQGRLVRFNPGSLETSYWDASVVLEPRGLATDAAGNIWWADIGSNALGRLEITGPNANRITLYSLPINATPYIVAAREGQIWFSAQGLEAGSVGILDPSLVAGSVSKKDPASRISTATCRLLGEGTTAAITPASGTLGWRDGVWGDVTPIGANGWTVYEASGGGYPYGILYQADYVWAADQWRQQLARITLGLTIYIPSGTSDVRLTWTPIAGATQYRVWYGEDPYFEPAGTPAQESATTNFTHAGVAADPNHNYFYVMRAVDVNGAELPASSRTGQFTFSLASGQ
jgi:streptogramin lyase